VSLHIVHIIQVWKLQRHQSEFEKQGRSMKAWKNQWSTHLAYDYPLVIDKHWTCKANLIDLFLPETVPSKFLQCELHKSKLGWTLDSTALEWKWTHFIYLKHRWKKCLCFCCQQLFSLLSDKQMSIVALTILIFFCLNTKDSCASLYYTSSYLSCVLQRPEMIHFLKIHLTSPSISVNCKKYHEERYNA
jgi:hypothetical protein